MNKQRGRISGCAAALALVLAAISPAAQATVDPVDPPASSTPSPDPVTAPDPTPDPTEPAPTPDPTPDPTPSPDPTEPAPDPTPTPDPTEPAPDPTDPAPPVESAPPAQPAPPAQSAPPAHAGVPSPSRSVSSRTFPDISLLPSGPLLSNTWSNPVIGRLTSLSGMRLHPVTGFGALHAGVDIAAACGTPVHAASNGIVVFVGNGFQGRTGNQVVIAHGDGMITRYGHLLSGTTLVAVGDAVTAGQEIAQVGGSRAVDPAGAGISTGCHLHFEVNANDGATIVNPAEYLAAAGVTIAVDAPYVQPEDPGAAPAVELVTIVDMLPGVVPGYTSMLVEVPVEDSAAS